VKKILFFSIIVMLSSCSLFDTFDDVPMYLDIPSVGLSTTTGQGLNTQKILDVEVFADGFSVGVFNLPAKVPILSSNESVEISIFPVIRNNGILSNPVKYPFYEREDYSFTFEAGEEKLIVPVFKYRSDAFVKLICDFEVGNCITFDFDENFDLRFEQSSETDYGDFCGKITIEESNTFFEKASFEGIQKSSLTSNIVFLEMDYRCDNDFGVGLILSGSGEPDFPAYKLVLNKQENWNKIYIEVSQLLVSNNIESFRVLLGTPTTTTSPGSVWVDNIKLVHF